MLPVRAVIFDLDDTLFDDAGCTLTGLRALAARHPALAALPDDALFARHAALLAALEGEVHAGRLSVEGCRERRLAQLLSGVGVPDPDGAEAARTYHAASRAHYRPLPGALDVVQALRAAGVRVGVLTNYPGGVQRAKLDACGLTPHLHASVTTSDAPPKPHPDSYLRACAALDVQAGEAVMVGDNWRNDVAGAVSAGLRAAWFNPARRAAPAPIPHVALHGWMPLDGTLAALLSPSA